MSARFNAIRQELRAVMLWGREVRQREAARKAHRKAERKRGGSIFDPGGYF